MTTHKPSKVVHKLVVDGVIVAQLRQLDSILEIEQQYKYWAQRDHKPIVTKVIYKEN